MALSCRALGPPITEQLFQARQFVSGRGLGLEKRGYQGDAIAVKDAVQEAIEHIAARSSRALGGKINKGLAHRPFFAGDQAFGFQACQEGQDRGVAHGPVGLHAFTNLAGRRLALCLQAGQDFQLSVRQINGFFHESVRLPDDGVVCTDKCRFVKGQLLPEVS